MLCPSALGPICSVQPQKYLAKGVLSAAARSYTRASRQQDDEGGQSMKRLLYLATFAVFALLLVPAAWAQT
jgi:hypothetical protein